MKKIRFSRLPYKAAADKTVFQMWIDWEIDTETAAAMIAEHNETDVTPEQFEQVANSLGWFRKGKRHV